MFPGDAVRAGAGPPRGGTLETAFPKGLPTLPCRPGGAPVSQRPPPGNLPPPFGRDGARDRIDKKAKIRYSFYCQDAPVTP